ncbi:MAG: peptide deformylase [Pirellulales bacterium]
MQIIQYPHPTLRHVSKPLLRFDAPLRRIVEDMFELMYAAKGVGLAANQVDLPLRFFIVNLESDADAREQQRVFINPVISRTKGQKVGEEGCLSLPGLYGDVTRSERITIHAYDLGGNEIREEVDGMLARVIQHETDHLDGILFIDRLTPSAAQAKREAIEDFEAIHAGRSERGELPSEEEMTKHWAKWEAKYC